MSSVGFGPLWRIDGPLRSPPVYGLLQAAAAPAAGVTLVTDVDGENVERWINGVELYPYPPGPAHVWDPCAPASEFVEKEAGGELAHPQYGAMTVYLAETCTSYKVWNQEAFKARAMLALEAVEGAAVAQEFLTGQVMTLNPHLADGNGTFPNGDVVTSPQAALALLEAEIAKSGQFGLVHMSPQMATVLANYHVIDAVGKVLRTKVGTVVIPDAGYVNGTTPKGHAPAAGTEEWMFATGTIEVRRSARFTTPDDISQALDRGSGATAGMPNSITYRVEEYALVTWDTDVQAAVLADRCMTECP